MSESAHAHPNYVKIWAILLGLLIVSLIGPEIGHALDANWIIVITAFGIAVVKAYMVCADFMHLRFEKKIVWFLLLASLIVIGAVFFFGVASDVIKTTGQNWEDCVANKTCTVEQRIIVTPHTYAEVSAAHDAQTHSGQ